MLKSENVGGNLKNLRATSDLRMDQLVTDRHVETATATLAQAEKGRIRGRHFHSIIADDIYPGKVLAWDPSSYTNETKTPMQTIRTAPSVIAVMVNGYNVVALTFYNQVLKQVTDVNSGKASTEMVIVETRQDITIEELEATLKYAKAERKKYIADTKKEIRNSLLVRIGQLDKSSAEHTKIRKELTEKLKKLAR